MEDRVVLWTAHCGADDSRGGIWWDIGGGMPGDLGSVDTFSLSTDPKSMSLSTP